MTATPEQTIQALIASNDGYARRVAELEAENERLRELNGETLMLALEQSQLLTSLADVMETARKRTRNVHHQLTVMAMADKS